MLARDPWQRWGPSTLPRRRRLKVTGVTGEAVELLLQDVLEVGDVHLDGFFFFWPLGPVPRGLGGLFRPLALRLRGLRRDAGLRSDGRRNEHLPGTVALMTRMW